MKPRSKGLPPESAAEGPLVSPPSPSDEGLSLEELSAAYAELLQRGQSPYDEPPPAAEPNDSEPPSAESDEPALADAPCELTPKSILEAILFVGNASNQPITSRQIAALMRGVRPQEIDDLVRELNADYRADHSPYEIASEGAGYRLRLREEFNALRDQFYGRIQDAKLTQPAIDVLAIVAYRQPIPREDIDQIRGKPSGGILSQLLRRGLLRVDSAQRGKKQRLFSTTDRFLQLFGLETISELPQSQDATPEE